MCWKERIHFYFYAKHRNEWRVGIHYAIFVALTGPKRILGRACVLSKTGGLIVIYGRSIGADFSGCDSSILFVGITGPLAFSEITIHCYYTLHSLSTSSPQCHFTHKKCE